MLGLICTAARSQERQHLEDKKFIRIERAHLGSLRLWRDGRVPGKLSDIHQRLSLKRDDIEECGIDAREVFSRFLCSIRSTVVFLFISPRHASENNWENCWQSLSSFPLCRSQFVLRGEDLSYVWEKKTENIENLFAFALQYFSSLSETFQSTVSAEGMGTFW